MFLYVLLQSGDWHPFTLMFDLLSQWVVTSLAKKVSPYSSILVQKFWSDHRFLNWKILNYFRIKLKSVFSNYCHKSIRTRSLNQIRHRLTGHIQVWDLSFIWEKKLKYFKSNFLSFMTNVTQTMEMKQNQTFFHGG